MLINIINLMPLWRIPVLILLLLAVPPAYSANCQKPLDQLRGLNLSAFSEYSQASLMRDDAMIMLYSVERTNCSSEMMELASLVVDYLDKFEGAYASGSENSTRALEKAVSLRREMGAMEEISPAMGAMGEEIVLAARESRNSFLENLAVRHENSAENLNSTREKLKNYKIAIEAYENSGNQLEASSILIKRGIIAENYREDMEEAERYELKGLVSLEGAEAARNSFDAYVGAREARLYFERSLILYETHVEREKIAQVEEYIGRCSSILDRTGEMILGYFAGLAVALTLLSIFSLHRIISWRRDNYDYYLGNELIEGEEIEG